jgi:hypothetical protein
MYRFLAVVFLLVIVVLAFFMVDIRMTDDGHMPDVTVDGARLPKFDVDMGSIKVEGQEKTVNVPQIGTTEKQITVPKLEIRGPSGEKVRPVEELPEVDPPAADPPARQ